MTSPKKSSKINVTQSEMEGGCNAPLLFPIEGPLRLRLHMNYSFDTELASEIGVNEAVIFQNIYYWIRKNEANNKHFYDDCYWTYNSITAFQELFDFWSPSQIRRILSKLIKKKYLKTANYNKKKYDRTLWYALGESALSFLRNHKIHLTKSEKGLDDIVEPIPYINTDINTDKKTHIECISQVIDYLNKKASTAYKHTTADTQKHIKARINEGFKLEDFRRVIDVKCAEWLEDSKMSVYIRPKTLFGPKFESYLNQKNGKKTDDIHNRYQDFEKTKNKLFGRANE